MKGKTTHRKIITDKLVVEKTGKTMAEWFLYLDKKGARNLSHVDIFNLVAATPGLTELGLWNQNLLATSYEWDRGIKERGQKENGFEISVSKTVAVPLPALYLSWIDATIRNKWLGEEKIVIRKTTENKSARVTWSDKTTNLSVDFYAKGENKSQVVVQHQKIPDFKKSAELKAYWGLKLEALKLLLEK